MTKPTLDLRETPEDLAILQDELRANEDCWLLDTSRQDKIACQQETQTIFLRVAATAQAPGLPNASVHPSRNSKVSRRFPRMMAWLDHFSTLLEGELGRVMLVRLTPRGQIYRHIDRGDYYQVRHRFHVMLNSPEGCWLECGGERCATHTGQIVWFDNKCPYEEGNPTGEWSVRLIVDLLPKARPPIPSRFKNFALIKAGVDVGPMLEEIDGQPQLWDADTRRQTNIQVQRETSNIPLRGVLKPIPEGINQNNWHPNCRTPYADRCPRIYSWVEQFVKELGGDVSRISIVRLNPHGRVYPHIDEGDYYKVRDRYHLVLRSPGGSEMNSGGEEVVFRDGELWWFNNKAVHDAFNSSAEGRVHVIFDVLPSRPAPFWADLEADAHDPIAPSSPRRRAHRTRPPTGRRDGGTDRPAEVDPLGALSAAVRAILAGRTPAAGGPSLLGPGTGVVQVELRASGRLVGRGWSKGSDYWEGLCQALGTLRQQQGTTAANELMLSLGGRSCELPLADEAAWRRLESHRRRGLFGYEIRLVRDPALVVLVSPFEFDRQQPSVHQDAGPCDRALGLERGRSPSGGRHSQRVRDPALSDRPRARRRPRGAARPRDPAGSARGGHARLRGEAARTPQRLSRPLGPGRRADGLPVPSQPRLRRPDPQQLHPAMDGHSLPHPSLAAARIGRTAPDGPQEHRLQLGDDVCRRGRGRTDSREGQGQAGRRRPGRTGAHRVAVRRRVRDGPRPPRNDRRLLWRQDGSFRTFYRPADRNDCQNFYPGEALLFWAKRIVATRDPAPLARFRQSFRYYRAWHLENRNPAFIPWHTQAYLIVWEMTREGELADAVFAMNDWLLGVQQWETAPHPDCQGRFYDPSRPFGPPHASSTAVYLEGLADAVALARMIGRARPP